MRILATGKTPLQVNARSAQFQHSEAGFTLIELLVAMAVMALLLGVAVLVMPNHDERYWRDNLDQLVSTLNFAQDESAMSGMPMVAQIDELGWRFSLPLSTVGVASGNFGNTFLPDAYPAQHWHKSVEMVSMRLSLGGEAITESLQIPIRQEGREAVLLRSTSGRFQWVKP